MELYKKNRGSKTTAFVINDIKEACGYLVTQKNFALCRNSIFAITITNTDCKHEKDLNHVITNRLFNRIKNDYKNSKEHTNYVFVIEYPEVISLGNYLPTNCKVHSHIVLNTSLTEEKIIEYLKLTFPKVKEEDIVLKDMTFRTDKEHYKNYLVKQGINNHILSDNSYNYKININ